MHKDHKYWKELSSPEIDRLDAASDTLSIKGNLGVDRYCFYRRKGHGRNDALRYALAWCQNATEQKTRRLDHHTGAAGWV